MTPERWQRVKQIVGAALEQDTDHRQTLLARECESDSALRAEVDSLVAAYERDDALSKRGFGAMIGDALTALPQSIGPYRLVRELGAGGMGRVWLAEQCEPVRRQVAIKIIRAGIYDARVLRRFLSERQSLALMNHPAIAKIFDAGATPEGQPYLVMEYVDGCPITEYCDRRALSIVERLRLFQRVCEGVQHAHQRAIIHRDLKPSNILVCAVDGKPQPQIIDFGVAKALSGALDAQTLMTQIGTLIGTVGYMSPEQAKLDAEDIDTRTDVYSLGVVLYELLVGALPVDPRKIDSYESLHRSTQKDARRPSAKLKSASEQSVKVAGERGTQVAPLLRQLRGDLDSIALKALEIDRQRRYATPAELAADIGNFLRNEPVLAHAPSALYRTRKYLRRHWAATAVVSVILILLAGFAVAQSIQVRKIRLARDRADRITGFMTQIFKVADPSEARGNSVTAREILDKASKQIESGVGLDASTQSDLLQVMGETYQNLGLYARAHALAAAALEGRRRLLGSEDPKTLASLQQIGNLLFLEGHVAEAEESLKETLGIERRVLGAENRLTLQTQDALVYMASSRGRYADAERLARQALGQENKALGAHDPLTLNTTRLLASALRRQDRYAEAEPVFRRLISVERQALGVDHPDTLKAQSSLANMLLEQGRYAEAEIIFREVLAVRRRVLGDEHPETADTMTMVAIDLVHIRSRYSEAEELYRNALAIELRQAGPDSRFTTRAEEGLANLLTEEGRFAEAESLFQEVLRVRAKLLGPDNTDTLLTQRNLACLIVAQGHLEEGERMLRSILEHDLQVLSPDDRDVFGVQYMLAESLLRQHRQKEAETLARQAFEGSLRVLGPQHAYTLNALNRLGRSLAALDRYDAAQALYLSTIAQISARSRSDLPRAWYAYAVMAAQSGHPDDAFENLDRAASLGFNDVESLRYDDDLKSLRPDPRLTKLLKRLQHDADAAALSL